MLGFLMLSKERFQNATTPAGDWLGRSSAALPEARSCCENAARIAGWLSVASLRRVLHPPGGLGFFL